MTQQPTWHPGAPPPPQRKRGWLVGLLVAGVVVLLALVVAVAIVVVRPWEDDDTAADAKPEPPPPGEIAGDIDGDGLGDAVAVYADLEDLSTSTHIWSSTGSSFEGPMSEDLPFGSADEPLIGDWDGDGARTVIGWDPVSGNIRAWDESFDDVELTDVGGDDDFSLVAGDFDGDGRTDLAASDSETDGEITIFVLLSNGDGFDAPAEWVTVGDLEGSGSVLAPGDFNADGVDDLLAFVDSPFNGTAEESADAWDTTLLTSTGTSFEVGELAAAPEVDLEEYEALVGDFDGSGRPQVLSQEYDDDTTSVRVFTWDGAALQEDLAFQVDTNTADGELVETVSLSVSDVDGDGLDDLVGIARDTDREETGVVVFRSTGAGFAEGETWGEVPDCDNCTSWMARGR
ncbi:FG-GAP repeat domain-containing protein [Nocardioides bizhenqiangii]|uniref:VCBS repeat-containing protein n=1 Tax=Nocardioides bizhenqiangii TaxID=3095076 RepID=A0ABZ0ZSR1_9ACTN|nr:VCBS repeat-containing protein [Nocardioides sp. HM61]WQQ27288.1 VCBS repeat-containing protein [Nocardioides sp. HM61]